MMRGICKMPLYEFIKKQKMRYLIFFLLFPFVVSAQVEYTTTQPTDSTFLLVTGSEEIEGVDSIAYLNLLFKLIEDNHTQHGRDLYRAYISDRQATFANRELNSHSPDTSYILYAREKFSDYYSGDWIVRGDTVYTDDITVNANLNVTGEPGRFIAYSNTKFVWRDYITDEDVTFFRDKADRRKYIGFRLDGTRVRVIKR